MTLQFADSNQTPARSADPECVVTAPARAPRLRWWRLTRFLFSAQDQQLRYLSHSARLEEAVNPRLIRMTALAVSLSVMVFLLWAGVTNINEVARTSGEVVPIGFEQSVQQLDGGIVVEISAQEGAVVQRGQLLARLDGGGALEDLSRAQRKQWAMEIQAERLRAFVGGREPNFAPFGRSDDPLVAEQGDIFRTSMLARDQQLEILRDQVQQKRQALAILEQRKSTIGTNLLTLRDLYARRKGLHEKGHLSYVQLASTLQELNNLEGDAKTLTQQIAQARTSIHEFQTRLTSYGVIKRDEAYRELHLVNAELEQNRETIVKLERRVERLSVRAPAHGIVKGIAINTVGGVVQPGETLMSILPLDEQLVVETRISPRHIGHLRIGQAVQVKVSTYDYTRYGAVTGHLDFLSATTFTGEDGGRYYSGRVLLEQSHVGPDPERNPILPGMTVMADIVTGEKTILEYLLKPVHLAITNAFSER